MLLVPWPEVIVPLSLAMLHEYVAPLPAVETDAVFRVELAQIVIFVLIVASGADTLMRAEPLDVPPVHDASETAVTE